MSTPSQAGPGSASSPAGAGPAKNSAASTTFERRRIPPSRFLGSRYYAGAYAGEHVAGGEFVVGAAFAAWGASMTDVIVGLIIGNFMAVLSWGLVCSPIATRARISLYYYLENLAGKGLTRWYSILNGVIFAVTAGGMITISASAARAWTDIPNQTNWYPTSVLFVVLAFLIGAATIYITVRGFATFSRFARLCSPWLMTVFVVLGLGSLPLLMQVGGPQTSILQSLDHYVWTGSTGGNGPSFGMWQIAAFAWGLNVPLHLGMGDLSTLRFARKSSYGFNSVFATFGGHFVAWLAAGVLGATTAAMLDVPIRSLDIGGIVQPMLGSCGLIAVVLACLTTAVPSLYRAGLAFQIVTPNYSRARVTIVVGVLTTAVACFPLLFLQWLNLMAYFNILLAPIGAIIAAEHFVLPRFGIAPLWRQRTEQKNNAAAIATWIVGIVIAGIILWLQPFHLFFTFIPIWIGCFILYTVLSLRYAAPCKTNERDVQRLYDTAYGHDDDNAEMPRAAQPPLPGINPARAYC